MAPAPPPSFSACLVASRARACTARSGRRWPRFAGRWRPSRKSSSRAGLPQRPPPGRRLGRRRPLPPSGRGGTIAVATRLLRLTLPGEGRHMLSGVLLLFVATGVGLLQPWPLKLVVDSVLGNLPAPWPVGSRSPSMLLAFLCLAIVLLQFGVGALTTLGTNILVALGLRLVFKLRCILFEHIQKLSLAFHDATPVGDSLYRVTWDSYAAQALINNALVPAVTSAATLVGIAGVMLVLDPAIAGAALLIAVPLTALIRRLDRPLSDRSMRA